MRETEKIWMNGELVDWADARIHVGSHGLHYGTGVFEGIRCYETPDGPAVFRLADHMQRLLDSARLLYMEIPYTLEDLRGATHEVVGASGLSACYIRPIAFYGYGELGVSTAGNPVETVIMCWPWGAYLGEDALTNGITAKISSWKRIGANTIPHAAKATGVYLNSMLATHRGAARRLRRGDPAHRRRAPSPTGRARTSSSSRDGVITTPPLSTSILPGITRETVITIARDLGYTVEEGELIRTDLYLADEVFMTGTAAEVTPVRAVDDQEIGVGDDHARAPDDLPRRRERAQRGVRGARLARLRRRRPPRREGGHEADPARAAGARRARDRARLGGAPLGPALARARRARVRGAARRLRRRRLRRRRSRAARPASTCCVRAAGIEPGDEVITSPFSFVASANCFIYEGGVPVFADIDPSTLNLDPAAVEAAITPLTKAIVAVDIFGYPCELDPLRELCDRHGLALIEDSCEALGAEYRGRRLGSHGHPAVFAFYPNKQMTTGEGGMIVTDDEEQQRLFKSLANQGRADGGGWLEHARFGFNYRLDEIAVGDRARAARAARRDAGRPRRRSPPATASCSPASTSSRRSPTTPTTCAPGSSTSSSSPRAATARR